MPTAGLAVFTSSSGPRGRAVAAAHRCARITVVLALATGALCCMRLAWADVLYRQSTIRSVSRACELIPYRAACEARLAFLLAPTDPEAALHALERAADLNPRDSSVLIQLGLRSEARGETRSAERYLLRAAAVDRTYAPRWALANYYFRRSDAGSFLMWARKSAEMAYGDMRPLFRLAWQLNNNEVERIFAARPDISRQYLAWLLSENRLDAAAPVAARHAAPEDKDVLLYACERFLQSRRVDDAVRTWNALAAARLVNARPLDPSRGISITEEAFEHELTGRGFDWRVPPVSGITVARHEAGQPLTISFSGRQAEHCMPLWQYAPVAGGARCRLEFEYRTDSIGAATGLRWTVSDATERADRRIAESPALSSEQWTRAAFDFKTPESLKLAKVALACDRPAGTTRVEGSISLRRIELRVLP